MNSAPSEGCGSEISGINVCVGSVISVGVSGWVNSLLSEGFGSGVDESVLNTVGEGVGCVYSGKGVDDELE